MIPLIAIEVQSLSNNDNTLVEKSSYLKDRNNCATKNVLTVRTDSERMQSEHNISQFKKISRFSMIKNNWDNSDALAPTSETINAAKRFVEDIDRVGLEVYFTSYGLNGEILIEIKKDDKAIEFYFDNENINEYAAFRNNEIQREGVITKNEFRKVIQWFNFDKWI